MVSLGLSATAELVQAENDDHELHFVSKILGARYTE
jgi:hypothetical protein